MKKTAVIYDKWLKSLGGGEVVACTIAKTLLEKGYEVTLLCGKKVPFEIINEKLNIDLKEVEMIEVWTDEVKLKRLTKGKDLFINVSFMDYSFGYAKRNIYYTHFPTKIYSDISEFIFNFFVIPILTKIIKIKPSEFITDIDAPLIINKNPAYKLRKNNRIAFFYLNTMSIYSIEFNIFFENFYKTLLENFQWNVENAEVIDQKILINHDKNLITFKIKIQTQQPTIYLNLIYEKINNYFKYDDRIFLFYPKIIIKKIPGSLAKNLFERINNKLRAGIFTNTSQRLKTYQKILANSKFTSKWILRYWKRQAELLYPPVEMMFKKYDLKKFEKEKIICSVGRFFTLGHGKKQEILIKAFKILYSQGCIDWQLHLLGGFDNEPTSIEFVNQLKRLAWGYPIYFHFNVSRSDIEEMYLKSMIYWHAAGFGEDEKDLPIKFEHFGIAPIEALSTKCIPILFNGGGLREVVENVDLNKQNHLFNTIDELVNNTLYFQDRPNQKLNWQKIFNKLEKDYSLQAFKKKFLRMLSSI